MDNEPTQDKTCCLRRFLDSLPFARNDMYDGFYLCAYCFYNAERGTAPHPPLRRSPFPGGEGFLGAFLERSGKAATPKHGTKASLGGSWLGAAETDEGPRGGVKHSRNNRRIRRNVPPFCHSGLSFSPQPFHGLWIFSVDRRGILESSENFGPVLSLYPLAFAGQFLFKALSLLNFLHIL